MTDQDYAALVYASIADIRRCIANAPDVSSDLRRHAERLWHACVGEDYRDLWTAAVTDLCQAARAKEAAILAGAQEGARDPFRHELSISSLLRYPGSNVSFGAVYDAFIESEILAGTLRSLGDRWDRRLARVVSDFQGACYELFRQHDQFAKAHVLRRVLELIYGDPEADPFGRFLVEQYASFGFTRPMAESSLAEILSWHRKLLGIDAKPSLGARIETALHVAGRQVLMRVGKPWPALRTFVKAHKVKIDVDAELARCVEACVEWADRLHARDQEERVAAEAMMLHGDIP